MPYSERSTCGILVIEFLTHPGDLMSNQHFVIRRVMPGDIRKREVVVRKQERIDTQPFPGARAAQIGMAIHQIKRNIVSRSDAPAETAAPVSKFNRQGRISSIR